MKHIYLFCILVSLGLFCFFVFCNIKVTNIFSDILSSVIVKEGFFQVPLAPVFVSKLILTFNMLECRIFFPLLDFLT